MYIDNIKFTNRFIKYLNVGEITDNKVAQTVKDYHFIKCLPTKFPIKKLIGLSENGFKILGWDINEFRNNIDYLVGNKVWNQTYAHCYAGHQFRNFANQLGDGRALLIGEYKNVDTNIHYDLQYKGSGLTPFSRFADGYSVLRSSIREFLASEYLNSLNIPTSMCLSLVESNDKVIRDKLYNGNVSRENCAIIIRFAKSFIRFGSFEISKITHNKNNKLLTQQILEFALDNYFPDFKTKENKYYHLIRKMIILNIEMVSKWNTYGFVHGVLNTDNINILGETIDFGPFGFMEFFDEYYTPNLTDKLNLYGYKNQINAIYFNSEKLLDSVETIISEEELNKLKNFMENEFYKLYNEFLSKNIFLRFGINYINNENNNDFIKNYFEFLKFTSIDFNSAFILIKKFLSNEINNDQLYKGFINCIPNIDIIKKLKKINIEDIELIKKDKDNENIKKYFLYNYNYYPDWFIDNQINNYDFLNDINNFESKKQIKINEFIKILENFKQKNKIDHLILDKYNPLFILRNCYLQDVIEDCEKGNYEQFSELHQQCLNPLKIINDKYSKLPSMKEMNICLSCSS